MNLRLTPFALGWGTLALFLSAITPATSVAAENVPILRVPFDSTVNAVIVPVRINGSREIRCILDTGMPEGVFLFDPAVGKELELDYLGQAQVKGVGSGTRTASVAMGASVALGTVEFSGQRIIVLDEAGPLSKLGAEGAIGASVFSEYVVEMDFEKTMVSLFDPSEFDPVGAGQSLPISLTGPRPYVEAQVAVDGSTKVPVSLLIDTGARGNLSLNQAASTIAPPEKVLTGVLGTGVGGDVTGALGRVESLWLGELELKSVVTGFPREGKQDKDGTLGLGILRRFLVTIDYSSQRILLKRSPSFGDPFEFNMAGVILRPADGGQLRVHHVFDASPAAAAGIRPDDILLSMNGEPLTWSRYARTAGMFHQDGETITVTVVREGEEIELSLKLERLI